MSRERKVRAHFPIIARFTGGAPRGGRVTIDPSRRLFTVREYKKRRTYELPLDVVAEFVVWHVVKIELKEKKERKKKERLERRKLRKAS